jgi:hypothetical protein
MDKKILTLMFYAVLLIPQDTLGQHSQTLSLMPETKTALLEAPKPKPQHAARNVLLTNAAMFASAYVEARAEAYGSNQCREELILHHIPLFNFGHLGGGQFHPYKRDLSITLPLDAGVSLLSWLLHKKHHDTIALLLPVSFASGQAAVAGLKYGAGCF